ncbi:hypothetical protein NL676_012449 [Syzygium grande]|nr:hypothetical protein NL676_012449 [Syzygium grande]
MGGRGKFFHFRFEVAHPAPRPLRHACFSYSRLLVALSPLSIIIIFIDDSSDTVPPSKKATPPIALHELLLRPPVADAGVEFPPYDAIEPRHTSGDLEELERTAEPSWSTLVEPFREDCRSMDDQIRKGVLNGVALKDAKREEFNKIEQDIFGTTHIHKSALFSWAGGRKFSISRFEVAHPAPVFARLARARIASGSLCRLIHHHLHRRLNPTPFPPQKVLFSLSSSLLPLKSLPLSPTLLLLRLRPTPPDSSPRTPPPPARGRRRR